MKIQPYAQVDDIGFTIRTHELRARRGPPLQTTRNAVGLVELDYGDSVFRFQDSGRLEEVTKRAAAVDLPQACVPFPFLKGFVLSQDAGSFERAGFIVSPRFGFAFAPQSPDWVTALAAHCIDTWRELR